MTIHLEASVETLKSKFLTLSEIVEEAVFNAAKAVWDRDVGLAKEVIRGDALIDQREVEIEEDCLRILALYQPVASDLRFIVTVLKINNDLERIGDLAANMASRAVALARLSKEPVRFDLEDMADKTRTMLHQSLDALVRLDVGLAYQVIDADEAVDLAHRDMYKATYKLIQEDPSNTEWMILLLSISRSLERIADLATNISEDVVYLVEGKIVRHQSKVNREEL